MANAAMLVCTESGRQPSAICIKLGIPTAFHWSRLLYVPFPFRVERIVKIHRMREAERLQTKGKIKNNSKFSDMDRIKLVVYNEYALGYIMPERPNTVYTLADSVLRGAPFRVMFEPYYIGSHDTVRLAGRQDFETFKVVFDGYDNSEVYEFDTNR